MTHTLINPNLYPDHQDLIPFVNGKLRLTSLKVTRIEYAPYSDNTRYYFVYYIDKDNESGSAMIPHDSTEANTIYHYKALEEIRIIIERDKKINSIL